MIRRPPRSTLDRSSAASDVYKRQAQEDCKHLRSVDHCSASDRQADARAKKETAKHGDQQIIFRHIRKCYGSKNKRQTRDRKDSFDGESFTYGIKSENNKRNINTDD